MAQLNIEPPFPLELCNERTKPLRTLVSIGVSWTYIAGGAALFLVSFTISIVVIAALLVMLPAALPAASYKLATKIGGRGVHSFCMCPGGQIVASVCTPGLLCTKGVKIGRL